jgi:hypothetical protein
VRTIYGGVKFQSYHSNEEAAARESGRLDMEHWGGSGMLALNVVPNEDLQKLVEERVEEEGGAGAGAGAGDRG